AGPVAAGGRRLAVPLALAEAEHRQPHPRPARDEFRRHGGYRCH
ncbi:MAG: Putative oxidoreductase, partial [uncultured Rubrobacteraceae bacterium]